MHLDICGGVEVADGEVSEGTVYRYISGGVFPYNLQCYRGNIALSQERKASGWQTFAVTNGCGNNADDNGNCDIFNQEFADNLQCTPGDCPYSPANLRSTTHELSAVYYQCTGKSIINLM